MLEGVQQGVQQGILENAKESVLEALSVRFHAVPARLSEVVRKIEDLEKLRFLLRQVILCDSLSGFEEILNAN